MTPTCAAALRENQAQRFDLALLDVHLDGETSAPVARALREAGVPLIVATGYSDMGVSLEDTGGAPVIA